MNIFAQEIRYVTVQEIEESSDILKDLTEEEIKIYISKAETIVDSLLGKKLEGDIPIPVKQAVILLGNCMYENRNNIGGGRIIQSEKRRGNEIVFATSKEDFSLKKIHPCMNNEIYRLLAPFIEKSNTGIVKNSFFRT